MSEAELLARHTALIGSLLIASGLAAIVVRRHLPSVVLGGFLTVLGSAVVLCKIGARENGWIAVVLLTATATLAPAAFSAFGLWRDVRGSSSSTTLLETDAEDAT